jgi:hypothetical protein
MSSEFGDKEKVLQSFEIDAKDYWASAVNNLINNIKSASVRNFDQFLLEKDYKQLVRFANILSNTALEEELVSAGMIGNAEIHAVLEKYNLLGLKLQVPVEPKSFPEIPHPEAVEPKVVEEVSEAQVQPVVTEVTPREYERFSSWKEFLGDIDLTKYPTLEQELRNTLGAISKKFPETYGSFKTEKGTIDYLGLLHQLYIWDVKTLNDSFTPKDSRTVHSTERTLAIIYRLRYGELLPPENFSDLARAVREGAYSEDTFIVPIFESLESAEENIVSTEGEEQNIEVEATQQLNESDEPENIGAQEDLEIEEEIFKIISAIEYLNMRAASKRMSIEWPVLSSVATKLTKIPDQVIDNFREIVKPVNSTVRGLYRYDELDVVKLVIYQKDRSLRNLDRQGLKKYFQTIDKAYEIAKERMAE